MTRPARSDAPIRQALDKQSPRRAIGAVHVILASPIAAQMGATRCGHRPGKQIVSAPASVDHARAATYARTVSNLPIPHFMQIRDERYDRSGHHAFESPLDALLTIKKGA